MGRSDSIRRTKPKGTGQSGTAAASGLENLEGAVGTVLIAVVFVVHTGNEFAIVVGLCEEITGHGAEEKIIIRGCGTGVLIGVVEIPGAGSNVLGQLKAFQGDHGLYVLFHNSSTSYF